MVAVITSNNYTLNAKGVLAKDVKEALGIIKREYSKVINSFSNPDISSSFIDEESMYATVFDGLEQVEIRGVNVEDVKNVKDTEHIEEIDV